MRWGRIVAIVFVVLFGLFVPGYVNNLYLLGYSISSIVLGGQLVVVILAIVVGYKKKYYGTIVATAIAGILASIYSAMLATGKWLSGLVLCETPSLIILFIALANLVGGTSPPPTRWHMEKRLVEAMAKAYEEQQEKQQEKKTKQEYKGFPGVNPYFDALWWGEMLSYNEEQ